MSIEPGQTRLHYRIVEKLGEGGMGVVWKAEDTKLGRHVAIKMLPAAMAADPEALARFRREARTLAAIDHPNIVTVHAVEQDGALHFLTMGLVDGETLEARIPERGMPLQTLLEIAVPITDALADAHERGVVHRDLKPGNVMIARDGRIKVLDFGLAKSTFSSEAADHATASLVTQAGTTLGTVPYMSPEQAQGREVDARSDVFSLGIMLYEMITGRVPFAGDDSASIIAAILRDEVRFAPETRRSMPGPLLQLVERCLEKDPARRPSHGGEVRDALRKLQRETQAAPRLFRSRPVQIGAVAIVVLLVAVGWLLLRRSRALAFQAEALPQLAQLAFEVQYVPAFDLAEELERVAGSGVVTDELWDKIAHTVSITSDPPGAQVTVRALGADHEPWLLGNTPLTDIRVPKGPLHWRVEHEGHVPAEHVSTAPPAEPFVLLAADDPDAGMVRVPGAEVRLWILIGVRAASLVPIGPFLIDRDEVTNRAYAAFVEAGGYERPEHWKHPFRDGAETLSFEQAMDRFRDATGRPGPAGWRLGRYPDGDAALPVTGISWYEAAAYAEFAGKELPTLYHWYFADTAGDLQLLPGLFLPESNFGGEGPRPAGAASVLSSFGTRDMAGNVREWTATALGPDMLTLGGAWSDPSYIYLAPEGRAPMDRGMETGFRCMRRLDTAEPSPLARAPVEHAGQREYGREEPVGEQMYAAFVRFFDREPVPLEPRVETSDEPVEHWVRQQVSYAAGYGEERMQAWLFLPTSAEPPYQTIVLMGGGATFYRRSSEQPGMILGWSTTEHLVRGGRAVLVPLWKGSYERSDGFHPLEASAAAVREKVMQWVSELRRSVDYLQSRDDIDPERIGYQGISYGAIWSPIFMALEPRLRAGLILVGGFVVSKASIGQYPPEIDIVNYAPRVTAPILMLNGRHDPIFPYETSQLPLFRAWGTAERDKRHVTFEAGHSTSSWRNDLIRESLDWLDTHFGEPKRRGGS